MARQRKTLVIDHPDQAAVACNSALAKALMLLVPEPSLDVARAQALIDLAREMRLAAEWRDRRR